MATSKGRMFSLTTSIEVLFPILVKVRWSQRRIGSAVLFHHVCLFFVILYSESGFRHSTPFLDGTLRWQSPELMTGQSQLTREIDVWAFSMCCIEILTLGRIPWGSHSDDSVRHFVLSLWCVCYLFRLFPNLFLAEDDSRPPLPDNSRFNTQGLQDILRACWSTIPTQRPTFSKLVKDFKQLRQTSGQEIGESPLAPVIDDESAMGRSPSPDMRPTSLPESYVQPVDNDLREFFSLLTILLLSLLTVIKRMAFYQTWATYFRLNNLMARIFI